MVRLVSIMFFALFLLLLVLSTGCGTLHMDLHTTVKPLGAIIQQVKLEGTGKMGATIAESGFVDDLRGNGWQATAEQSGDSFSITATKRFGYIAALVIPALLGQVEDTQLRNVDFHVRNLLVVREYFLDVTVPGTHVGMGMDNPLSGLGREMLSSMFTMSWTISLPGTIVETNADAVENNSATWYFDIDSLQNDRQMTLHTKYIAWPIIALIGAGIALVVFLVIFLTKR